MTTTGVSTADYLFVIILSIKSFFGLEIVRQKIDNGHKIIIKPYQDDSAKTLQCSHVTILSGLRKNGLIPQSIPAHELWHPGDNSVLIAKDGQNKLHGSSEGTLFQVRNLDPGITLGFLAYGYSDQIVGFFFKGAKKAKLQISLDISQISYDCGMMQTDLIKQVMEEKDYEEDLKVANLS